MRQSSGTAHLRQKHHKALMIGNQVKIPDVTGILNHISIVVILKSLQAIQVYPGNPPVGKKPGLVIHPMTAKLLYRIVRPHASLIDRNSSLSVFLHFLLHLSQQLRSYLKISFRINEKSLSY